MTDQIVQQAMRLHEAGRIQEAASIYQEVLRANPRHYMALYSLGFACAQTNQHEQAIVLFSEAIAVNARDPASWFQRGISLYRLGRNPESLHSFDRTLALQPGHYEALVNRAVVLLETGRPAQALASCDTALALQPNFPPALVNRGNALVALGQHEDGIAAYDVALALNPGAADIIENRENAEFQLGRASRCPPGYMRRLFDEFSVDYDLRMLDELGYRAHLHVRTLYDRVADDAKKPSRILDLGSGTGLAGEAFKDISNGGYLEGIDLSPLMNDAARQRGLYDHLVLGDLEKYLAEPGEAFDLILAADTMIYIGDLAPSFAGVARRLQPGALYIFAVEAKDGDAWEQTAANRFRHSISYLREQATRAGLEFVDMMEAPLRNESGVPVVGYTIALRRPLNN